MADWVGFTQEEFDTMVDELLYREPISFDMLCRIAMKTLRPKVEKWCKNEPCLKGRGYEEDILQNICLRLMKKSITSFFLNKGVDGVSKKTPSEFAAWMHTLAKNYTRTFAANIRNRAFKSANVEILDFVGEKADIYSVEDREERIEKLKKAFAIVMSSDVGVYKTLTWLAQFVFILEYNITKIESNEKILEEFAYLTLGEMYNKILSAARTIPWLEITDAQHNDIVSALNEPWDDERVYGEVEYHEFFMKQNGVVSGKKSASDWVYRLNEIIKRRSGENQPKPPKKKKTNNNDGSENNGSSDI